MRPEDIVDGDSVPRGTRELRRYLEYLRTGLPADVQDSQEEPENDFEMAVMEALSRHGYQCTPQLGVAGYRIDLAVRHPNHPNAYMAAIECDGASYHSGRSARDRDRIRQEILERLGWSGRIFRIWSSDWYLNPANETGRLVTWLNGLKSQPMNEAYLETQESETDMPSAASADVADSELMIAPSTETPSLESLGVQVDEGDLEVQIGDRVTITYLGEQREATLTISTRNDDARGEIHYRAPLADALLGLQEGEITALSLPNRPPVRMKVLRIERVRQPA
jgi:transcription elongation GreA/GreB family factor/very-short-patch-repair endonuclease